MIKINILLVPGGNMDHVSRLGEISINRVGPVRGNDAGGEYVYDYTGTARHHGEPVEIVGQAVHLRKENVFELISACLDAPLHNELARLRAGIGPIGDRHGWDLTAKVVCVECPGCGFTFDADHEDTDRTGYTCPVCGGKSDGD